MYSKLRLLVVKKDCKNELPFGDKESCLNLNYVLLKKIKSKKALFNPQSYTNTTENDRHQNTGACTLVVQLVTPCIWQCLDACQVSFLIQQLKGFVVHYCSTKSYKNYISPLLLKQKVNTNMTEPSETRHSSGVGWNLLIVLSHYRRWTIKKETSLR